MEEVLNDFFINRNDKLLKEFDACILLQPTSPLRKAEDLLAAQKIYEDSNASLVLSANIVDPSWQKLFVENEQGNIEPLTGRAPFANRQSLPALYKPNGAVYIFSISEYKETKGFPLRCVKPFKASHESEIDLDNMNDWNNAEKLMETK